jgi:hypothetical protein
MIETIALLDRNSPTYALDVVSLAESILESPTTILNAQQKKAQGDLINQLKAEGVEYEDRMKELERVTYPKPNAEFIYDTFNAFAAKHPWVGENIRPKSIVRDMYERYMTFADYIKEYGLTRTEGVLLRYLSDAYKTIVQTVPEPAKSDELIDIVAFLRALLERIDSSLVAEWESLVEPGAEVSEAAAPPPVKDISRDQKSFYARIRHELHTFVRALAASDFEEAALSIHPESTLSEHDLQKAMERYFEEYPAVVVDPRSRTVDRTQIERLEPHLFQVRHTIVDPEDDNMWFAEGTIDLRQDRAPEGVLLRLTHLGR